MPAIVSSLRLSFPLWTTIGILGLVISAWSGAVNSLVTIPYLDEYFHVRQARKYIDGHYLEWDPKITTPPGLYVISTVLAKVTGWSSLAGLRAINALLLPCLALVILDLDNQLGKGNLRHGPRSRQQQVEPTSSLLRRYSLPQLHSALNTCLFPVMFFYSALYYTDIASVLSVLVCWNYFLRVHVQIDHPNYSQQLVTIVLGLLSLTFRQTNIFWVSIFPAAILLVSKIGIAPGQDSKEAAPLPDPPVCDSRFDDYIFFLISLGNNIYKAVRTTVTGSWIYLRVIRLILPYVVILASFAVFVLWNGGVVLGDKSNHIATIHLTQMLYLWPYMMFFSFPLIYLFLIQALIDLLLLVSAVAPIGHPRMSGRERFLPRTRLLTAFTLFATPVVYYNTIIHPFTLADNRHYPFYVFRLLTRYKLTKFAVIPIYYICAWATIQTLCAPAAPRVKSTESQVEPAGTQRKVHSPRADRSTRIATTSPPSVEPLVLNQATAGEGAHVSFVLIWLATTALNLVTAPLVEPRYFILPWLMWRLRVPLSVPSASGEDRDRAPAKGEREKSKPVPNATEGSLATLKRVLWDEHDHRLWLETLWFLAINAGTGYMFLYRGFEWAHEPEQVQRFMW